MNKLANLTDYIDQNTSQLLEKELRKTTDIGNQVKILEDFLIERLHISLPFIEYIENALKIIEDSTKNRGTARVYLDDNILSLPVLKKTISPGVIIFLGTGLPNSSCSKVVLGSITEK